MFTPRNYHYQTLQLFFNFTKSFSADLSLNYFNKQKPIDFVYYILYYCGIAKRAELALYVYKFTNRVALAASSLYMTCYNTPCLIINIPYLAVSSGAGYKTI